MSTRAMNFEHLKRMIRDQLMHGKGSGATRTWLAMHTGANDRTVRLAIEDLRSEGWLICNDQDGEGYYLALEDQEILRQYRRDCARAMSILKRLKAFRMAAREIEQQTENKDQVTIEEILMLMEGKI